MSELKAGVIINYASILISLSTSFFLTPFVIEKLGMEEYGLFMLSGSVISWLALSDMGLGTAVRKYVTAFRARHEEKEQKEFLGQATLLFSVLALLTLIVGVVCFFYLGAFFPDLTPEQHSTLQILYLLTLGNMIVAFPLRPLACVPGCYLKYIIPGVISLSSSLLSAGLTVLLLVCGYKAIGLSVLGVVMGVAGLIAGLVYTIGVLGVKLRFGRPNWKLYREMFQFSFWVLLSQLIDLLYWRSGTLIVARLCGVAAVPLYSMALSLASYFTTASMAITGVVSPKLMQMVAVGSDREELTNWMIKAGRLQLALAVVMLLELFAFGTQFLTLWVGTTMGKGVWDVWLGAIVVTVPFIIPLTQNAAISILQAMSMHKGRAIILLYSALLCVALGYLLTGLYGPPGMFMGTAISLLAGQGLWLNFYYHRRAGLNIPRFFRETYGPAILPAAFLLLAGWGWAQIWAVENWGDFFVAAGVYGTLCAVVLFVCYLNQGERAMFLDPLKRVFGGS